MKNIAKLKLLIVMIFTGLLFTTNIMSVNAAAQSLSLGEGVKLPAYLGNVSFYTKVTKSGDYVYCLDKTKKTSKNVTANLVGEMDAGFAYLITNGYPNKSITGDKQKDYYITQTAVWWYLDDTTGSHNLDNSFKSTAADNYKIRSYIINLVNGAKQAKAKGYVTTTLTVNQTNSEMALTSDGKYYQTVLVKPTVNNISIYKVSAVSAPNGTQIIDASGAVKNTFAASESFRVRIPVANVNNTTSISIKVSATGTVNKAYQYKPTNTTMQNCMPAYLQADNQNVETTIKFNITASKTVNIIKLDSKTNKPLAGATLVVKDAAGNKIDSWTTTTNAHIIRNLKNGTYYVSEVSAPQGYKLSTETVKFTVTDDTKEQQVKFYNTPRTSVVTITKINGSTDQALAGAVLAVKDSTGKEVARFTTTTNAYQLVDLAPGTYTVYEVSAPAGFKKSNEEITFQIDNNNLSYQVTFKNYPEVVVPDTASSSSLLMMVVGIFLIGGTLGFVRKYATK